MTFRKNKGQNSSVSKRMKSFFVNIPKIISAMYTTLNTCAELNSKISTYKLIIKSLMYKTNHNQCLDIIYVVRYNVQMPCRKWMQSMIIAAVFKFLWSSITMDHTRYTPAHRLCVQQCWVSFETTAHCRKLELPFFLCWTWKRLYTFYLWKLFRLSIHYALQLIREAPTAVGVMVWLAFFSGRNFRNSKIIGEMAWKWCMRGWRDRPLFVAWILKIVKNATVDIFFRWFLPYMHNSHILHYLSPENIFWRLPLDVNNNAKQSSSKSCFIQERFSRKHTRRVARYLMPLLQTWWHYMMNCLQDTCGHYIYVKIKKKR